MSSPLKPPGVITEPFPFADPLKAMHHKLASIVSNSLWVKVIVKRGDKESFKIMKVVSAGTVKIIFHHQFFQPHGAPGDSKYRIFWISDVEKFENTVLPVFHIREGVIPTISKDFPLS